MHRSPVAPRRPRPLQFFSSFSTSPPATTPVCPSSCPSFPRSTLAFILPHRQSRGWALLPPTPSPARALFPPQPLCRSSVCLELGRVSFPLPLLLASSRHPRSTPNAACAHPSPPPHHTLPTPLSPPSLAPAPQSLHHHLRLSPLAPRRLTPRPLVALHRHSMLLNLLITTPTPASLHPHYSPRAASPASLRFPISLSLSPPPPRSLPLSTPLSLHRRSHTLTLSRVFSLARSPSLSHSLSLSLSTTATHLPPLLP